MVEEPVLRIAPKKYNEESTVISMRLAKDLVREIDHIASLTGRNRDEILAISLEFPLSQMEILENNGRNSHGNY